MRRLLAFVRLGVVAATTLAVGGCTGEGPVSTEEQFILVYLDVAPYPSGGALRLAERVDEYDPMYDEGCVKRVPRDAIDPIVQLIQSGKETGEVLRSGTYDGIVTIVDDLGRVAVMFAHEAAVDFEGQRYLLERRVGEEAEDLVIKTLIEFGCAEMAVLLD